MTLHEKLYAELDTLHRQLLNAGDLPSRERLTQYYATFRARFGPEQLQRLDGEALLETIHDHGNHDSLVYWLESQKKPSRSPASTGINWCMGQNCWHSCRRMLATRAIAVCGRI